MNFINTHYMTYIKYLSIKIFLNFQSNEYKKDNYLFRIINSYICKYKKWDKMRVDSQTIRTCTTKTRDAEVRVV